VVGIKPAWAASLAAEAKRSMRSTFLRHHAREQFAQPGNGAQQLDPMITAYSVVQPYFDNVHFVRQGLEQDEIQFLGAGGEQLDLGQ
jgi:hypothetical protein